MNFKLAVGSLGDLSVDVVIVGIGRRGDDMVLARGSTDVDKALGKKLLATVAALGATGKPDEVVKFASLGAIKAPTIVAVGLGKPNRSGLWPHEAIRRAVGAATRSAAGSRSAATALAAAAESDGLRAAAEGAAFAAYSFTKYRHDSARTVPAPVATFRLVVDNPRDRESLAIVKRVAVLADAVTLVRDLVNTPPGDLHPADLAEAAVTACTGYDVDVEVLDEKALKKGGYGGILGVGAGSANPPRLVRLSWAGGDKPVASVHLVGKGITFDSGGLSLKLPAAMEVMKSDMGGAAAVMAAVRVASQLRLGVAVTAWMAIAENMPSGSAIRPSDVLTIRGGKTVEVLNTDAEGRLVMADAIVRACEESPDYVLDVATLTGSQLIALGSKVFAVMGDDAVRAAVVDAARRAGELAWPMPLPPELRASLDSQVADIANMGDRNGGMLVAGLFLRDFVAEGVEWAHLDIAGPSYNEGSPWGYTPVGATGVPVRTLVEWLETLAATR